MKKIVWSLLRFLGVAGIVQLCLKSGLKEDGWFKSFNARASIDAKGKPIAWYCYTFVKFLENRLNKEMIVFEYGAGNSTFWYAERVKNVHSVEHDKAWYKNLLKQLPQNATVKYVDLVTNQTNYITQIKENQTFYDIIIVDGRRRNDCVMFSVDFLTPKGVLILDNSEREDYIPAKKFLTEKGFKSLDFVGMPPSSAHNSQTSVYYRTENILGI